MDLTTDLLQPIHPPMTTTCPEDDKLLRMVAGTLLETEEAKIVDHLDACQECQERIEKIAVGNSSIIEVAASAKLDTPPEVRSAFWPALKKVELDLETPMPEGVVTRRPADVSATITSVLPATKEPSGIRSKPYAFLEPAEEPEYLGQIDRFKIVELVGKGGMGMVFRAFDSCLQRTVAVKVLDPQYATNEQAQNRFCREARAAAGVTHENVVTIHHVEHIEARDLSFIVMQFVKGRSLQDMLDQNGPVPVRESVRIAAATASGLAAAHANGLIHRDIKPGNILMEQTTNRVLLTDFGLARLNEDVKITQTGFVAGTPLYMSPEQARGDQLSASSDLFSLGSVLYAMLTGNPPFQGSSAFVVLRQVTETRHRPVQDVDGTIPSSIAEIVDRLLDKNPKNRFKDASEVAGILNAEFDKLPNVAMSATRRSSRLVPAYARNWWRRISPLTASVLLGGIAVAGVLEGTKTTQLTVLGQRGLSRLAPENDEPAEPTSNPLFVVEGKDGAIWSVAFDRDSKVLATASEGGMVRFYSTADGKELGELNNMKHKSPVWNISFNNDGTQIATASDDAHLRIWDVKSKELVSDIQHSFSVRCAAFSPDGSMLVSGTRDGELDFLNPKQLNSNIPVASVKAHAGSIIMALAFSPDGSLVASAGSDREVRVWHAKDGISVKDGTPFKIGTPYTTFRGNVGPVYSLAFSEDGKLLATAGWDHKLRIYDVQKSEPLATYDDVHREDIWGVAFSPDGKHLMTAGQDRTARWVNADTGRVEKTFRGNSGPVHSVAVASNGNLIATGGRDGSVRVWNPND